MARYAAGKRAIGECARSGGKMLLKDMVGDGYYPGLRVDPAWHEPKHPLERLPRVDDPVSLRHPAPERSKDSQLVTVRFPLYDLDSDATVGRTNLTGTTHDPAADTIKAALYSALPDIDTYTATDEVIGTGYTAGGETLVFTDNGDGTFTAADTAWTDASLTAVAVVLYNVSQADAVIAILPFGGASIIVTGTLTIEWADPLFTGVA